MAAAAPDPGRGRAARQVDCVPHPAAQRHQPGRARQLLAPLRPRRAHREGGPGQEDASHEGVLSGGRLPDQTVQGSVETNLFF